MDSRFAVFETNQQLEEAVFNGFIDLTATTVITLEGLKPDTLVNLYRKLLDREKLIVETPENQS